MHPPLHGAIRHGLVKFSEEEKKELFPITERRRYTIKQEDGIKSPSAPGFSKLDVCLLFWL
ncbi:hypothetical protein P692DRAFT_2036435 [Suillus brevipes Sb2]|nr:hypothetical protein P692DRAFT_2036435 [Suillus brevipes Sb2]